MKVVDVIQGTSEWHDYRAGRLTASVINLALAKSKDGKPGASSENLAAMIIAERLTGVPRETYVSAPMLRGTEHEPEARALFAMLYGVSVTEVGFVDHPTIEMAGCSPDGLVNGDGLVEIKSPNTSTHIRTLLGVPVNGGYMKQIQFQLACTGRDFCMFCSYDPRMPAEMQLFTKKVSRDNKMIAELEHGARIFLDRVSTTETKLRNLYLTEKEAAE